MPKEAATSPENWHIFHGEEKLGFSKHNLSSLQAIINPHIVEDKIPIHAVHDIVHQLKLNHKGKIEDIIKTKMVGTDGSVDANALLLVSILLCSGKTTDKARLVWKLFDKENKGTMTKPEFEVMVKAMAKASLEYFVELAGEEQKLYKDRVVSWKSGVTEKLPGLAPKLITHFFKESSLLTREEFLERIWQGYEGDIMLTFSLRRQIEHLPTPQKYTNPFRRK
jgi:hypothetical protein